MKKFTTLKTLLVGLLACAATSAWADATSIYERGTTNAWADTDLEDWSVSTTSEYLTYSINGGLYLENTSPKDNFKSSYSTTKSISTTANSIVTMTAVAVFGSATGRSSSYDYITFGGAELRVFGQGQTAQVYIDGTAQGTTVSATRGGTYTFNVVIDQATKNVTYSVAGGATIVETSTTTSTAISNVVVGHSRGGSENYNSSIKLTNVNISEEAQVVTNVDYTIYYKLGDNVVKTVTATNVVGNNIIADAYVDGEGAYVGNHYLIIDDEAPSMTLVSNATSNVLNVPVRAPYSATLIVTTKIAGIAGEPVETPFIETNEKACLWYYSYPMYVQKDGVYYVADNIETFGETGSFTDGQKIEKTVNYTNPDYSVVYFGEPNEGTGSNPTFSNGATGFISGGKPYATCPVIKLDLPAGEYTVKSNVVGQAGRNLVIGKFADTSVFPEVIKAITSTGEVNETITLTETTPISISGKDQGSGKFNQSADIDYVLVKSSTEIVSATIGSKGFATFASGKAVDLEGTGLKAYTGKLNDEKTAVKFTEITGTSIPANTGVLLEGDANKTYFLKVATSASSLSDNDFIAGTGAAPSDNTKTYFAMVKDSDPLAFGKIAAGVVVPANKAYLAVAAGAIVPESARLTVTFDGEATGIKTVENAKAGKAIYNLNGQRVDKVQKGLYIVNGKKTIVK